jgi:hypothetical protein
MQYNKNCFEEQYLALSHNWCCSTKLNLKSVSRRDLFLIVWQTWAPWVWHHFRYKMFRNIKFCIISDVSVISWINCAFFCCILFDSAIWKLQL